MSARRPRFAFLSAATVRTARVARLTLFCLFGCVSSCASEKPEATDTASFAARVCANATTTTGIDVSYYQGEIDWGSVAASGVRFAIARVSDGASPLDTRFDDNWSALSRFGLVRGAYQYFEPDEDPIAQADLVVEHVGVLERSDLPVALDVETTDGLDQASLVEKMDAWLARVEAGTRKRPMIYTSAAFWNALSAANEGAALWVANYDAECPELPGAWNVWSFWQTGTGTVAGIATSVDLDRFDGSALELSAFAENFGIGSAGDAGPREDDGRRPGVTRRMPIEVAANAERSERLGARPLADGGAAR